MKPTHTLFCSLLVLASSSALAADWPQWRGPARDGQLASAALPAQWPAQLAQRWKIEVGEGHASPVVSGDTVFVFSRIGEDETLTALALADGTTRWRKSYSAPYTMNPAAVSHGKGPKSTPVVADGRIFTLGITGVLSAHETKSGDLLWRKEFTGRFKSTAPEFGTAMSPLVDGKLLLAHVGGDKDGALAAFDVATGNELWKRAEDGPGYASPVVAVLDGVRQLITQTQRFVVGIDLASGALLWRIPFETAYEQNSVTPLVFGDTVIYSGLDKGVMSIRPRRTNGAWSTPQVWRNEEVSLYMNSPVLAGDRLCGLSHRKKGQYFCLDAATGKMRWTGPGRGGENASLIAAGDVLLSLDDTAALVVLRAAGESYSEIARYETATSPTWAHLAVAGKRLLVKDRTRLTAWDLP